MPMNNESQGSLFGEGGMTPPARRSSPDPQALRARLGRLIDALRAAKTMPLSERDVRMWQTVVPNMTRWLPEAEGETIRATFAQEMSRLGAPTVYR